MPKIVLNKKFIIHKIRVNIGQIDIKNYKRLRIRLTIAGPSYTKPVYI